MSLTQDQIDFFHQNGYLKFGPLLEPTEIETLRTAYDIAFKQGIAEQTARNLAETEADRSGGATTAKRQMYQIMQMCERSLEFRKLIYDTRILDVVQDLIGPNIMLFHDQALWKPAHTGGPVHWHQDNGYWKCRPANLVSCWLTLDDVTLDNGAMQVIPGSHLKPVWHKRAEQDALLQIEGVEDDRVEVIDLPAGGCMFHHCQTLHTTNPNDTDRQRRAFAIHYMPPGTIREAADQPFHVDFAHPMLRMRI